MSKYSAIATILLSVLFVSESRAASVLEELDAANKAFARAVMAGDVDALVNDYTDDGCVIAPMAGETCGKEAIRAFWESVIATKPKNVEIITEKAGSEGRLAFATGQLLITDADSSVHKNRFAVVFKKVGGQWKLRVDSWNPQ
jgi:ketosteroid isomerase-like protein